MWYETGMALANGDFDGDGDLDIIVGAGKLDAVGRLYLFKNDGEGNFLTINLSVSIILARILN